MIRKILTHLGLWQIKARPRQVAHGPPDLTHEPFNDWPAPSADDYLTDTDKDRPRLFTFLKYPNLQPTNNQAERSLRGMVIFRKICMGTRSPDGSHTHSVLLSLLLTAQRQGRHPLGFFETLFCSKTQTAPAALYNDSS